MYRRRRLTVLGVAVAVVVLVAVFATGGGSGRKKPAGAATASKPKAAGPPHLVVSMASWQLPGPLSRTVALPVDGSIDVFGGLTGTGNTTTADISQIDPASGQDQKVGTLPAAVHDAAGAVLGSRYLVFGGGAADVTSLVQAYSPDTPAGQPATSVVGHLPARRADVASATAPDGRVYLAGGYDGAKALANVIETRDGKSFSVVGQLPVPVRYAAMAVAAGKVWVMGGDAGAGGDTTAIQTIDLQTHKVVVAGHLPVALAHASAADLGGTVYLFGGRSGDNALDGVWRLDTATASLTQVGTIPVPTSDMSAAVMGETVYLVGGEGQLGQPGRDVVVARLVSGSPATAAGAAGPPFEGKLLIADRGNNRLLLVNAQKKILWTFPSPTTPAPAQGFYFPDDAFFAKHGTAIITNEEDQDTILELAFPSGQVIASYGHHNVPGRAPGYLNQPDDAYLLKDGTVTVADAKNCRILFLNANFTYASEIGHTGRCHHDIPNDVAYPNGDTPLADGNFLVSEIFGSYVDEVTRSGNVVWSVKLPIAYPSDPQQIGPDLYLIADYSHPGGIFEFTREGKIVWSYQVPSGEGMLDHPSLAERLPNGDICVNDDYRHRVVIIDPADKQIVWQYGLTDTPGSAPGQLKIPDGFDLLAPDGTTPTHPQTG
ncbi:MAG: kelch repeat-containing protein [Acidimicrobiales bacterium]